MIDQADDRGGHKVSAEARYARRPRQVSPYRAIIVVVITSALLLLGVVWGKSWVHKLDCSKVTGRLAAEMEHYRQQHGRFPTDIKVLHIKPGRYRLNHFRYRFAGFGAPAKLADGALIAYCIEPHKRLFGKPWRHVLVFDRGRIEIKWLREDQFQALLKRQKPHPPF